MVLSLAVAFAALAQRRHELARASRARREIADARRRGSHEARLQHPWIDRTQCIGCGACVAACPEDGVLALVHGQAAVVHGARCVGHARCAEACPTGAVAVTLGDVSERRDLPALSPTLEVKGSPGLYLAGEVTGYALVRTAIAQGTAVADEIFGHLAAGGAPTGEGSGGLDLLVVGAGPAGIACALRARERRLRFQVIEQEELGGTVAKYPRRKLVMTQPVRLPLHGVLSRTSYGKEELLAVWEEVIRRHDLPVRTRVAFEGLTREPDGHYTVQTSAGAIRARAVVLAIGRRGRPRKLDVPGEDAAKVAYHLVDAAAYQDRRVLVVGGGDSAVEAALGLGQQPGNEVSLSYRRPDFFRIKARNEERLEQAVREGRIRLLMSTEVARIEEDRVHLRKVPPHGNGSSEASAAEEMVLDNDDVFVLAGGVPPYRMLEASGVSFDPGDRDAVVPPTERGSGVLAAVAAALVASLLGLAFVLRHADYYLATGSERVASPLHPLLRPSGGVGLAFGLLAALCMLFNLTYLVRRSRWGRHLPFSLRSWLTVHLATGLLALVAVALHAGLAPRDTVGGHAFLALTIVVFAGAVGRYLYALVPRAASGREMALDEVRAALAGLSADWDRTGGTFAEQVRREIEALATDEPWRRSLPRRLGALFAGQRRLRTALARLRDAARAEGVPEDEARRVLALARRAHRAAVGAAHYEEVRGVMASWRYLHRWLALLLVLLVVLHVWTAIRYAELRFSEVPLLRFFLGSRP